MIKLLVWKSVWFGVQIRSLPSRTQWARKMNVCKSSLQDGLEQSPVPSDEWEEQRFNAGYTSRMTAIQSLDDLNVI